MAPKKLYYAPHGDMSEDIRITDSDIEYIRKDTIYKVINKRLQELWRASSSQADNDEYYKNPLVKQLKGLINEIESL